MNKWQESIQLDNYAHFPTLRVDDGLVNASLKDHWDAEDFQPVVSSKFGQNMAPYLATFGEAFWNGAAMQKHFLQSKIWKYSDAAAESSSLAASLLALCKKRWIIKINTGIKSSCLALAAKIARHLNI